MKQIILLIALLMILMPMVAQVKSSITDSYNAETALNYSRALEIMQDLARTDPNDEFYQVRIGWLQYLLGSYNDALKAYQSSNKLFPNLDAQIGILNCYLALGKWNEGIEQANDILKVYPHHTTAMAKAAFAAYMKQEFKLAADYYARIIRIAPWDTEIRGYLVNNLYLSKDTQEAKKHYLKLKKYSPESQIVKDYAKIFE